MLNARGLQQRLEHAYLLYLYVCATEGEEGEEVQWRKVDRSKTRGGDMRDAEEGRNG